jgi:amidophosphoribosyltransferase
MGHTRWRRRGDERINRNNHPIRTGHVLGTHNGTIYNADELFRRYRLPRFAEVDSEVLFRIARTRQNGRVDIRGLVKRVRSCRGQIAAVMASRRDPNTVLDTEGQQPARAALESRLKVALYASVASYLDKALSGEDDSTTLEAPVMTLIAFKRRGLPAYEIRGIDSLAQATPTASDLVGLRQPRLEHL